MSKICKNPLYVFILIYCCILTYGLGKHAIPKIVAEGALRAPDWLGDQRRRRQDVVGKATPGRRGPRDLRWSFGDAVKKAIIQQRAGPLGLWLSRPGEWKRHNAGCHKSGGSIYCSSVRSPTPSHSKTLSNPFQTLTIKWEVHIFLKESSLVLYHCVVVIHSAYICI